MTIAAGKHLFPSRTQQLSPPAPMVLPWQRGGRVGHRRVLLFLVNPFRSQKERIVRRGWTSIDFASAARLTPATIYRVLAGKGVRNAAVLQGQRDLRAP